MAKFSINLLQADLLPSKAFWTLNRVVLTWVVALLIMLTAVFFSSSHQQSLMNELTKANLLQESQKSRLVELEKRIAESRQDQQLLNKIALIKAIIANKQHLHMQLTDPQQTYSAGFSTVMAELAQLHNKDISLQRVNINNDHMTFAGLARSPDAVPLWLTGFESATFLSGKTFANFTLTENKRKMTEFVVSSAPSSELDSLLNKEP